MASSFDTASQKLAQGIPPFPLRDLPTTRDELLWTEIRSEYSLTLAELSSLKNHACEEQHQRRPPLYPDSTSDAKEWNTNFDRKLDQILEATKQSDKATPQYSAAFVGNKEKKRLVADGRFSFFHEKVGEASVLTVDQAEALSTMKNEHQVVAYMTPYLEELVRDTVSCSVFNSEEYKWIETSAETTIYNEKPDLIIMHPAFINRKPPFKCEKDKVLEEMRRDGDLYGVLSQWKLRDFIGLTCEAKQSIDNQAFGEVINYGAHLCFGTHGSVATRLMLFDKRVFWLVDCVQGVVASVVTCRWIDEGSRQLLRDFVRQPVLPRLLNDACAHFNLTVKSDSFLGAGAYGFVFRAQRADGIFVALKTVLKQDADTNIQRLEAEKEKTIRAKNACPDEVVGVEEDGFHTFEDGAALVLSAVGDHFSTLSPQGIVDSLKRLHKSGIIHGDARLENVVGVNGKPCWVDFADSDLLLQAPLLMEREMNGLIGCVQERFEGYEADG